MIIQSSIAFPRVFWHSSSPTDYIESKKNRGSLISAVYKSGNAYTSDQQQQVLKRSTVTQNLPNMYGSTQIEKGVWRRIDVIEQRSIPVVDASFKGK